MVKREEKYNRHHILAKSKGGSNHKDNIRYMKVYKHDAIHRLFLTKKVNLQILEILKMSETALSPQFIDDIKEVLENHIGNCYKQHCMKGNKYNKAAEIGALFNNQAG